MPSAPIRTTRRLESISTAANYLGVSTKTIRRYITAGRLTGYRAGPRLIRVDLNELDAMLRAIPTAEVAPGPPRASQPDLGANQEGHHPGALATAPVDLNELDALLQPIPTAGGGDHAA